MLLQNKESGVMIEVLNPEALVDPVEDKIQGRVQAGQEEQQAEEIAKASLVFPSGETLPRCWIDANYRLDN